MQSRTRSRQTKWAAAIATAALATLVLSLLVRSTVGAQEFRASPIEARFFPPQQMTEYEVLVTAPAGSKLTYTWSGPDCGDWAQPDPQNRPNFFRWHHPHPPCDPTTDHKDRTIVVVISDGKVSFNCTYQGAASGVGPACTTQTTTTNSSGTPVTSAPAVTTPVDEDAKDGGGSGLGIGLGALGGLVLVGGGYFVYTRSRAGTVSVSDWDRLRYQETVAQEAVLGDFKVMLDDVNAAWAAYRKAVDMFRMRYNLALSASSEMQGLLVEWAEVRGIAQKQDLAFAIVTLLWSGGSLALKGARWLRSGQAAAATVEAAGGAGQVAAATTEAATAAGTGAKTVGRMEFFAKYLGMVEANQAKNLARMAEEAGMTMAEAAAKWGDNAYDIGVGLSEVVAQQRGWVTMAAEAEATVGRVLVNGRAAIAGRGAMSAQDVAQLQQWASRPGFWERLAKAAGQMDEIGWMGERPEVHEFIGLLYNADDIAFLKRVAEAGGDLAKLRSAVGPAQAAVLGSMDATLAGVVVSAPTAVATGQTANITAQMLSGDPITQLGDLRNFVDQFGVTNKIDTMSVPGFIGSELWALVSSPFETYQRHRMTHEALDQYEDFIKNHASTLGDMSTAVDDAVRAMERIQRALNRAMPGDAASRLRQKADALRDILNKMRDAQSGHGGEFEERRAHIEQKLAQIEHVSAALAEMQKRIPQMLDWLKSLRDDPSGGHRSLFEMMNPEIGVRLISAQTFLDMSMANAYRGGPAGPATGDPPPTPPAAPMQPYENPPAKPSMTDEEIDRMWDERVREHEERVKAWEAIPESPEIPDDWFRHLDDPAPPKATQGGDSTPPPAGTPR